MRASEVIEEMRSIYVPGAIKHYDSITPNPWDKMLTDFEKSFDTGNVAIIEAAGEQFISRAKELVSRFKADTTDEKKIGVVDAFMLGPDQTEAWESRLEKKCIDCETPEDLVIEDRGTPRKPMTVLVCRACKVYNSGGVALRGR